jgi:hypothetical protein
MLLFRDLLSAISVLFQNTLDTGTFTITRSLKNAPITRAEFADIQLFFVGDKHMNQGDVKAGESLTLNTYHGHNWVIKDSKGSVRLKWLAENNHGRVQNVKV